MTQLEIPNRSRLADSKGRGKKGQGGEIGCKDSRHPPDLGERFVRIQPTAQESPRN